MAEVEAKLTLDTSAARAEHAKFVSEIGGRPITAPLTAPAGGTTAATQSAPGVSQFRYKDIELPPVTIQGGAGSLSPKGIDQLTRMANDPGVNPAVRASLQAQLTQLGVSNTSGGGEVKAAAHELATAVRSAATEVRSAVRSPRGAPPPGESTWTRSDLNEWAKEQLEAQADQPGAVVSRSGMRTGTRSGLMGWGTAATYFGPVAGRFGPGAAMYAAFSAGAYNNSMIGAQANTMGADDRIARIEGHSQQISAGQQNIAGMLTETYWGLVDPTMSMAATQAQLQSAKRVIGREREGDELARQQMTGMVTRRGFARMGEYGAERAAIGMKFVTDTAVRQKQIEELERSQGNIEEYGLGDIRRQEHVSRAKLIRRLRDSQSDATEQHVFEIGQHERKDEIARQGQQLEYANVREHSMRSAHAMGASPYLRPVAMMQAELDATRTGHRASEAQHRNVLQQRYGAGIAGAPMVASMMMAETSANQAVETLKQSQIDAAIRERTQNETFRRQTGIASIQESHDILAGMSPSRAAYNRRVREGRATVADMRAKGDPTAWVAEQANRGQEAVAYESIVRDERRAAASIDFSNESMRILTDPTKGRLEDRQRQARSNDIVRMTQQAALRAADQGQGQLIPSIYEGGRLQALAQQQQYLNGFRSQEVNLNRVASSGNAEKTLSEMGKAMEQLKKVPTADQLRQIVDDAIKKIDQTR